MRPPHTSGPPSREEILAAFGVLGRLAAYLVESSASTATPATPRYATAKHNPLGSERGFKAACASGAFPTFKLGRQIGARWEDVERYVEGTAQPVRQAEPSAETDVDRAELEAAGVRFPPASGTARRRAGVRR